MRNCLWTGWRLHWAQNRKQKQTKTAKTRIAETAHAEETADDTLERKKKCKSKRSSHQNEVDASPVRNERTPASSTEGGTTC